MSIEKETQCNGDKDIGLVEIRGILMQCKNYDRVMSCKQDEFNTGN